MCVTYITTHQGERPEPFLWCDIDRGFSIEYSPCHGAFCRHDFAWGASVLVMSCWKTHWGTLKFWDHLEVYRQDFQCGAARDLSHSLWTVFHKSDYQLDSTMFCCLWGDRDSRVRIHGWKVEHKNREVSYKMYLFRENLQSAELYGDKNQVESFVYQISCVSFSHKSVPILQMQIESIQQCQPWLVQPTRQMVDLRWLVLGWN